MPRMRFLPGLIFGLFAGFLLGAAAATFILPPRTGDESITSLQQQQLTRQLGSVQQDRDDLRRQVEEFRVLSDRMTTSFSDLERRFKAMEEELRARDARQKAEAPRAVPPEPPPPPPDQAPPPPQ